MKLWSIDVAISATAYIKADTMAQAMEKAKALANTCIDLEHGTGTPISPYPYDSPDLPNVSLSPAMTIDGPPSDAIAEDVHSYPTED